MRTVLVSIVLSLALTCIANSAPVSEADLKNLLAAIRQNRITQADFQEQRVIRLMKNPILSSGKVWFQPPNKFRREVKGNSPSLTVSDGRQLWIYYPNFKSAERYPLGKGSPLDSTVAAINSSLNLEDVENTFQIVAAKIENGYELRLMPRSPSMRRVFQKLDLRINEQLRVELYRYAVSKRRPDRNHVFESDARACCRVIVRVRAAVRYRSLHATWEMTVSELRMK